MFNKNVSQSVEVKEDNIGVVPPKGFHIVSIKGTQGNYYGSFALGWTTCPICERFLAGSEHHVHLVKGD
jgi:hypothetical protein